MAGVPHPVLGEDVAAWVVLRARRLDRGAARVPPRTAGRLQGAAPHYRGRRACRATRAARSLKSHLVPGDEPRSDRDDDFTTLTVEEIGRVRRITLNRPDQHNPLTPRCVREILACGRRGRGRPGGERDRHPQHGPLVLVGLRLHRRGHRSRRLPRARGDRGRRLGHARVWPPAGAGSGTARIPVIAQVQGNCLAGGTDLALHCDLVVAAEDARIGFPPVRSMGVPPTNMWLYHLGPQWTKRLAAHRRHLIGRRGASRSASWSATAPADELDDGRPRAGRSAWRWSAATCSWPTSGSSTWASS